MNDTPVRTHQSNFRGPLVLFSLLCVTIIAIEGAFYLSHEDALKKQIFSELSAIADLKQGQIVAWREERLALARYLVRDPIIVEAIEHWERDPAALALRGKLMGWMRELKTYRNFSHIAIVDHAFTTTISLHDSTCAMDPDKRAAIAAVLASGRPAFIDLHRKNGHAIHLDLIVPFRTKSGEPLAACVIEIDPDVFLFPLIKSWPMPSRTAETLLFRRCGDSVEYLNELRHRKNTALTYRLPSGKPGLLAGQALRSDSGIADGIDYRDQPALGAFRAIPGSPWYMVAKIDKEEVFHPVRRLFATMLAFAMALIACAGLLFALLLRHHSARQYKALYAAEQEKTELAGLHKTLFENSPDTIVIIDSAGRLVKINRIPAGPHTIEGLIGQDAVAALPERTREAVKAKVNACFGTGELQEIEHELDDGKWVRARIVPLKSGDAVPQAMVISTDITARKKMVDELTESEARFRALSMRNEAILNTVPDIIAEVDTAKVYTWMNMAGHAFFGGDAIGREASYYFEGEQSTYADVEPLFSGSTNVFYVESWQRRHDGEKRLLAWWCHALQDANGNVRGALSTARDITEFRKAEAAIAAEKERLLVTLRSIGDGVISTDTKGVITLMNKVAEELTGWAMAESVGRPLGEVFHIVNEETRRPCENPVDKVLATGGVVGLANHTALIAKDGHERTIADSGAPIRDAQSRIIGTVLVFRDITEKQKTEEALRNAEKLESLGALAAGIAHDFNNLLGGIFGYVDMAASVSTEKKVSDYLARAMGAMDRARDLTRQLLTFAKGGAPVRKTGPLFPFVKDTAQFALSGSSVSCACSEAQGLWPCSFDKNQIGQVVDNIVINAQQSMPGGGQIVISAENTVIEPSHHAELRPGRYVKLSIKDGGIGIPAAILPRIFDPFFTTKQKGSGLGLATAYSIVNRHGGAIRVESEAGKGAVFHIYLPAAVEDADAAAPAPATPRHKGHGTVIVMDDEAVLRGAIADMLESLGYKAACFEEGSEVVRYFSDAAGKGRPFAAIILDLTIPGGMGGKETAEALRKIDPTVPLFVASGYAEDPVLADPAKYGFTASLVKPFVMADLALLLGKYLQSRYPRAYARGTF
jgi:PAS domain S-box-containing protein